MTIVQQYKQSNEAFDRNIDYILKNNAWYPKGFKTHLSLFSLQLIAASAGLNSVYKDGLLIVSTFKNKNIIASVDYNSYDVIIDQIVKDFDNKGIGFFKEYNKKFVDLTEEFRGMGNEIYHNFDSTNSEDIKKHFINLCEAAIQAQSYAYITEVFNFTGQGKYWVKEKLHNIEPNLTDEEIDILLQPSHTSFVNNYEKDISNENNDIQKILHDYYWIKASYSQLPELTQQDILKEKEEIEYKAPQQPDKDSVLDKYQSDKLSDFVNLIDIFIKMQDDRKENAYRLNYGVKKLLNLIQSQQSNWSMEELLSFTPGEVITLLANNLNESEHRELINKRNNESVWVFDNQGYTIKLDADIFKTVHNLFTTDSKEVKGMTAFKGVVEGSIKVILSEDDFSKMEEGDILVTSMTRPEFMPVMKKASAFITNEGGVTCHAAIISRELEVPCIIGTKNATQILKDGDKVKVNTNKGIVKIIERKNG